VSTPRQQSQGGLSLTTLVIASAASVAAAIVVHEVWRGGAILGAAITPIVVAIVSESLRRPVDRVSAIRDERRTRTRVQQRQPGGTVVAPPPELERPDPFGIWQEPPPGRKVQPRHLKLAFLTGLAAFVIGGVALTGTELVFGGNVGGGDDRVTIVPGGGGKSDEEKQTTTETQPDDGEEEQPTEPAETQPTEPTETAPQTTEPAPTTTTPPPTPAPETPAPTPETPAPAPPGETPPGG
jgi:hypothetical protein